MGVMGTLPFFQMTACESLCGLGLPCGHVWLREVVSGGKGGRYPFPLEQG